MNGLSERLSFTPTATYADKVFRVAEEIVKARGGHAVIEFPQMRNMYFRLEYELQIPEFIEYTLMRVGQAWKCRCDELLQARIKEQALLEQALAARNTVTANAMRQTVK